MLTAMQYQDKDAFMKAMNTSNDAESRKKGLHNGNDNVDLEGYNDRKEA